MRLELQRLIACWILTSVFDARASTAWALSFDLVSSALMMPPRLVILIHIPKTAGTTLSHMLRLRYAVRPANWLRHARTLGYYHLGYARPEHIDARMQRLELLTHVQRTQVRFFAAHAGFGLRERLPEDMPGDAASITVLRDPVARMISTYHHLRAEGRISHDVSLEDYVDQARHYGLFKFDNCQTRYLAGDDGRIIDVPVGACTTVMADRAIARLEHEFLWFGLTERFDESVLLLADRLHWARPRFGHARRTASRRNDAPPDRDLVERMREHNRLDQLVYDAASRMFEDRIRQQSADFPERLAAMQRANQRWRRVAGPLASLVPGIRRGAQRVGILK